MPFTWMQKSFKDFVGTVIAHKNTATGVHYRDEPTIMAWEIANAPVCPGDDSGDILQVWACAGRLSSAQPSSYAKDLTWASFASCPI